MQYFFAGRKEFLLFDNALESADLLSCEARMATVSVKPYGDRLFEAMMAAYSAREFQVTYMLKHINCKVFFHLTSVTIQKNILKTEKKVL